MIERKSFPIYTVALHGLLIALALSVVLLARQNQQLREQLGPPTQGPTLATGDKLEPFTANSLDGHETVVAEAVARESLIFFFTTTCPSCQQNQDRWRELYERVAHRMDVVGVSLDDPERTRLYDEQWDLPFQVVTVPEPQAFVRARELFLVPFTVHLGGDGRVRDTWLGVLTDEAVAHL